MAEIYACRYIRVKAYKTLKAARRFSRPAAHPPSVAAPSAAISGAAPNRLLFVLAATLAVSVALALAAFAQDHSLGVFTNESSVGQTPPGVKAVYDSAKGEYTITGGGANVWATTDAFYFVWRKVSGDVTLTADVQWVGTSSTEHRKAMLMIRQSLDPGSAYADAVGHGNGLTSLQFRGAPNENTYQVVAADEGPRPIRLRIVRKGSRITMYFGKPGSELPMAGPVEFIGMQDPFYVGLGVCSHVATTLETAIFSNVRLEEASATK